MPTKKLLLAVLVACACVGVGGSSASAASKKPKPAGLTVEKVRVGSKDGPIAIRVREPVHTKLRVWVNGKLVRSPAEHAGKRSHEIVLSAADGVRPGVNRLKVRASRHGEVSVAHRTVEVPRALLYADAGHSRGTAVSRHVRLGAHKPFAPGKKPQVRYHWEIVGSTKGAKAKLTGHRTRRPLLRAHRPGTFKLRMSVHAEEWKRPAYDTVTISASPDDPPLGVPIKTLAGNGAIVIGGSSYGANERGLAYVVLERTTRTVVKSGSVGSNADGLEQLNDLANEYGGGGNYLRYLMIVSGANGIPEAQGAAAGQLFKRLGSPRLRDEEFLALRVGLPFSVVGVPGAPMGAATICIPGGYSDPVPCSVNGYLQKNMAVDTDGTPIYDFVATEYFHFDTRATGSSDTRNIIALDQFRVESATLGAGQHAALHVLVLESRTLRMLDNLTLVTNADGDDRGRQAGVATSLKNAINRPGGPLVMVQTIGKPKSAGPEWAGVVREMTRLGANPLMVNALDGTTEYALVSRLHSERPPAEASTAYDVGPYPAPQFAPARLLGEVSRTRTSTFEATIASTPTEKSPNGGINGDLAEVAYQPATAWPELAPGADASEVAAAQKYICQALNFCQPVESCASVRECYWKRYSADWSLKHSVLTGLGHKDGEGFGKPTFEAVKATLLPEIAAVANVQTYVQRLQEPLEKSAGESYVDLQAIGQQVWESVQRPAADNNTSWILGLIGKGVAVGQLAGPPASAGFAGISAIFLLASYLSTKDGTPILGGEVKVKTSQLAAALYERVDLARAQSAGLGRILVSDYGKLTKANARVDSTWALPGNPSTTATSLRIGAKQWFYEELVPVAYPYLIRGNGTNARALDCQIVDRDGWPNQPDSAQMAATVGYGTDGRPIRGIYFFSKGIGGAASPPASLGPAMFSPRNAAEPGLGIEKMHFFNPRVFNKNIAHAVSGRYYCEVGWLPISF